MFEVRIHGRGGQGVVTGAEILSVAAFHDGRNAQAFPSFGSERMGAPVVAFCRICDKIIRSREPIAEPDCLIVQDATLFKVLDLFSGLRPQGYLIVNTNRSFADLHIAEAGLRLPLGHAITVPATEIAQRHIGRPLPNAALLGAFAALTRLVNFESVSRAISEAFSDRVATANIAAAQEAYTLVRLRETAAA